MILKNPLNAVLGQRGWIIRYIFKNPETVSIVPVKPRNRGNPYHTPAVRENGINLITRESVTIINTPKLIGGLLARCG